jgi:lipid-A-disaccharide synthase
MTKKYFIIAGEASGDLLGSKLISEIKALENDAKFIGVGGELMKKEGLKTIFPMNDLAVMGFFEILPHIFKLLARINQTARAILEEKPDYIITIDSPDFCFRVIKKLPRDFSKKVHLIAPSVWAYREGRAAKVARIYNLLLCILPFEPPYFEKYGLKSVFIGHPIIENAPDLSLKTQKNAQFRQRYKIAQNDILLCLTPGSRISEVKKIFPEFIGAVDILRREFPNLKVAIPLIEKTENLVRQMVVDLSVPYFLISSDEKVDMFFSADFAMAKSGTNAVEISLYKIPLLIAYKINKITHFIVKRMIKIKYANLINLILNKELIPEMLQDKCNAKELASKMARLISDKNLADEQIDQGLFALKILGFEKSAKPSKMAAAEILKL